MTKAELLEFTLKKQEIEAFGGTVKVRELTVKEAGMIADATGATASLMAVSFALVEPAMSVEELELLPAAFADDFAKIIEAITS